MRGVRVSLKRRLKAFGEPDTGSVCMGYAEGVYTVHDKRRNFPTDDTDYVLIDHPKLGEVWICTRWMETRYAEFEETDYSRGTGNSIVKAISETLGQLEQALDRRGDPYTIKEEAIVNLTTAFGDFRYNLKTTTYPYKLHGLDIKLGPPYLNNCCTFLEALLVKAWSLQCENFEWDEHRHSQMMILSDADYFSPVTAVVESGIANLLPNTTVFPAPWTIMQVWHKQWGEGHTLIVVDCHKQSGKILTLEANDHYMLCGVGFRGIGMLRDLNFQPPDNWWELPNVWTWNKLKQEYPFRKMAALKVKERHWSGVTDLVL
jgi:hypothetical protein